MSSQLKFATLIQEAEDSNSLLSSLKLTNSMIDYRGAGQFDMALYAQIENEAVGRIVYSVFRKEYHVQMIRVEKKYRRLGVATKMYNELKRLAKEEGCKIDKGYLTNDGAAWNQSLNESFNHMEHKIWYHSTTSLKNAKAIEKEGFRLDMPSTGYDLYGKAAWFSDPPHNNDDWARAYVCVEIDSSWKIADIRSDDGYTMLTKILLEIPEIQNNAKQHAINNHVVDVNEYSYFDEDLWRTGLTKLGYDGLIKISDDGNANWIAIYNIDKLNSTPRKVMRREKDKYGGYHN